MTSQQKASPKRPLVKGILIASNLSLFFLLSACSSDEPVSDSATVETTTADPEVVTVAPETEIVAAVETDSVAPKTEVIQTDATENESADVVLASDAGVTLYESNCKACHASGLLNAPKYGDKAGWALALQKDKQTLYLHSANGFNKMPAQAVNGVTEAQVKAAVDYMLAAVS
ncbi:c-type cytochrome [Psychrobacter sp. T6-4]